MLKSLTFLMAMLFMLLAYSTNAAMTDAPKIVISVVVSSEQDAPALKLSTKNLNLIYWRKQRFWPQGIRIKPVNLRAQDPIRVQFSSAVLNSVPNMQTTFWNEQYFNGILPPHSVNSQEAVLRFVANTKGAIGYVNACKLDTRVTPLLWLKDGKLTKQKPDFTCK